MKYLLIALSAMLLVISCKDDSKSKGEPVIKDPKNHSTTTISNNFDALIDSLRDLKPADLSITEERSDRDKLIPIGYNDHGSFAYFLEQDMGGASGYEFHIQPTYDIFSVNVSLDIEMQGDSVLDINKDLIGHSLRMAGIRLNNTIQRSTLAELEKKYKIRFSTNKTFGPPNTDYDDKKKTLASVNISYDRGDGYPTYLINENYQTSWGVWDCYVSDILLVPTKELGMFGFAVIVTESIGFEGYTRKVIKLISLGDVDG